MAGTTPSTADEDRVVERPVSTAHPALAPSSPVLHPAAVASAVAGTSAGPSWQKMASKTNFSREPPASNQAGYHDELLARLRIGTLGGLVMQAYANQAAVHAWNCLYSSPSNHGKASPAPPVPGGQSQTLPPNYPSLLRLYVAFAPRLTILGVLAVHHRTISPQTPDAIHSPPA